MIKSTKLKSSKVYPIGSKLYCVYNRFKSLPDKSGAEIYICKVVTYTNVQGVVTPVLKNMNTGKLINSSFFDIHEDISKAVAAITNKKS